MKTVQATTYKPNRGQTNSHPLVGAVKEVKRVKLTRFSWVVPIAMWRFFEMQFFVNLLLICGKPFFKLHFIQTSVDQHHSTCPKNHWTLQWRDLNLYSRVFWGPQNSYFWGIRILRVLNFPGTLPGHEPWNDAPMSLDCHDFSHFFLHVSKLSGLTCLRRWSQI